MGRLIELVRAYQNASATHTAKRFGEEIIRTVGPLLHRYIRSDCPPDVVDDVFQECCIAIATSTDTFKGESDERFFAWCYGITRHKIAEHYRRAKRQPVPLDLGDIEKILDEGALTSKESEQLRHIWTDASAVLTLLHAECRELILERYFLGLDWNEIGVKRNQSEDAARMATSRCLERATKLAKREGRTHAR